MKLNAPILILSLLLIQARGDREFDAFYVWQQAWSPKVVSAVAAEPATLICPLATVIPDRGESVLANIPWSEPAILKHRMVPVIRIPLNAFKRPDIAQELSAVTARLSEAVKPGPIEEVQLDLDCPESLLADYVDLLQNYRRQWPDLRLSITALPAHLSNISFRPLAEAVDYYVLQVHGISVPAHLDDPSCLLDLRIAKRAIEQAENLGRPYRIALPCYAYELNFDPASGRFLYLTAERPVRRAETVKRRIAAEPADLAVLLQEYSTLDHACGIIWFRLPVKGDRLCWPRATLAEIQSGSVPEPRARCRFIAISDTTFELELHNDNAISACSATVNLSWPNARGTCDLYESVETERANPGQLPAKLTVPLPPPGQAIKLGWFQSTLHPESEIELE